MKNRIPLINVLQRAFFASLKSRRPGGFSDNKLANQQLNNPLHRRQFIGDVMKTGIALSAAGLLNACRKVNDFTPSAPPIISANRRKASQPKIVIIGAGIAGLNCAYTLKKAGFSAAIYEASSRTGGRIFTKKDILAPGLYTELGGEFIDTEHTDMLKLCQEFGLSLLDTRTPEESSYARDSFYIDGKFYSEEEVIRAFRPYASRIKADINSLPDVMTYDNYDANTLRFDMMSIKSYLDSINMTGFIRKGIETAYTTEYGLEADIQSSINFIYLFSPYTARGFDIFGASDERYKIQGGNQSLTDALYEQVKENVLLEHKLMQIKEIPSGYELHFKNNNTAITVYADIIVSAIPFTVLREVILNVALPAWKLNAIRNLGYGNNAKLLIGFDSKVWRKYHYSGYAFTNKALQTGWDNSWEQAGKNGGYTVYQGGNAGLALGTGTPESQASEFINQLNEMWPGCKKAFNGNVKRMHWPTYPFTKASYACYKTGQYTSIRGSEIKPVGNFYFAGEHCSSYYQGFMNGAAETGRIAAHNILKTIIVGQTIVKN